MTRRAGVVWAVLGALGAAVVVPTAPSEDADARGRREGALWYVAIRLEVAYKAFEVEHFDRFREVVNDVGFFVPDYNLVPELRRMPEAVRREPSRRAILMAQIAAWRQFTNSLSTPAQIPRSRSLATRTVETWRDYTSRLSGCLHGMYDWRGRRVDLH